MTHWHYDRRSREFMPEAEFERVPIGVDREPPRRPGRRPEWQAAAAEGEGDRAMAMVALWSLLGALAVGWVGAAVAVAWFWTNGGAR